MRVARGVLAAGGIAAIAFGAVTLARRPLREILSAAEWFLAPPILSDLVLMPLVALLSVITTRWIPVWLRIPVQVAFIATAALTAVAIPFLGAPGRRPDNPSLLNRDYPAGLATYLAVIVISALLWAAVRLVRRPTPDVPDALDAARRSPADHDGPG